MISLGFLRQKPSSYEIIVDVCISPRLPRFQVIEIDHFTVVCSVTWPLNGSEAEGDLVLIQTSLLLLCKSSCVNAN